MNRSPAQRGASARYRERTEPGQPFQAASSCAVSLKCW
jgi:hypothetical protein